MQLQKASFSFLDKDKNSFDVEFIWNQKNLLNSHNHKYNYQVIIFKNEVQECTWTTSQFANKTNALSLIKESIERGLIQ